MFLFGTAHRALKWMRDFCGNSNKIDTGPLSSFQNRLVDISPFWQSNGGLEGNAGSSDEKELTPSNVLRVVIIIPYFGIYSLLNRRRNAWYASELRDSELLVSNPCSGQRINKACELLRGRGSVQPSQPLRHEIGDVLSFYTIHYAR